jgi:hypothetical protein
MPSRFRLEANDLLSSVELVPELSFCLVELVKLSLELLLPAPFESRASYYAPVESV